MFIFISLLIHFRKSFCRTSEGVKEMRHFSMLRHSLSNIKQYTQLEETTVH